MRHSVVVLVLILSGVITACGVRATDQSPSVAVEQVQQEAERGKYRLINGDTLWELYQDSSSNLLLIDTRQEWEFRTGHIASAVHFSMEPTWFARISQRTVLGKALGVDKERTLVFY